MSSPHSAEPKRRPCPLCGTEMPRAAALCPQCEARLTVSKSGSREPHSRRYVYGKRKQGLSQEATWLLVVIVVGLLLVLAVQLLAYMRDRKLVQAPAAFPGLVVFLPSTRPAPAPPHPCRPREAPLPYFLSRRSALRPSPALTACTRPCTPSSRGST